MFLMGLMSVNMMWVMFLMGLMSVDGIDDDGARDFARGRGRRGVTVIDYCELSGDV